MVSDKYTYYIDFGSGFTRVIPKENTLSLDYLRNKKYRAVIDKNLSGSFILDSNFDTVVANFQQNSNTDMPFKIYRDGTDLTGTLVYYGNTTEFNDYDYNQKRLVVKDTLCIENQYATQRNVIKQIDYSCKEMGLAAYYTQYDILSVMDFPGERITEFSYRFADVFNNCLNNGALLGGATVIDPSGDVWASSPPPFHDITKLRMCPISSLRKDSSNVFGGTFTELKVEDMLNLMLNFYNAHWYITSGTSYFKFKKYYDLKSNTLSVVNNMLHKKRKSFNNGNNYEKEVLKMHPNNYLNNALSDWIGGETIYQRTSGKNIEHDCKIFQTKYTRDENININGWFIAYMASGDNVMDGSGIYVLTPHFDNSVLCNTQLMLAGHSEYLYTNRGNYTIDGAARSAPTYLNSFIELPKVEAIINPETFYDSLLYDSDTYNYFSLVEKQSTNLNTNITTFEHYDFTKELIV
jgi:hypothetical protein